MLMQLVKRRIVISKYNCKDDLRDALIKTSFLPIIINGSITTNDNCIDCGIPYIVFQMICLNVKRKIIKHYIYGY